jgi:hypothetical protein
VEWPTWVREPHVFLRYLVPGFMFMGCAAAFFPQTLSDATRAVPVAFNRTDLILLTWLFWSVMIGVVFHSFYHVVYEMLLRPGPRPQDVVRNVMERLALPGRPLSTSQLRALYAMTLSHCGQDAALSWARRETHRVHLAYESSFVLALVGLFIAAHPQPGPLVSVPWAAIQGLSMVVAGGTLALLFAARRDALVRQAEAAAVHWDSERVMGQLASWAMNLQRAGGQLQAAHPQPPGDSKPQGPS